MAVAVQDVMMPEPWTLDAHTTLQDAAQRMRLWDVDDVFVVDGDQFCGVLTVRNIVVAAIASGRHPATVTARECCEGHPDVVRPDDAASRAAGLMARHELGRLPVVDDGRLVGTIWAAGLPALSPT